MLNFTNNSATIDIWGLEEGALTSLGRTAVLSPSRFSTNQMTVLINQLIG